MRFILEQSDELLTPSSGLALVGECLLNKTHLNSRLNKIEIPGLKFPVVKNHEVVFSYIGLLCQGKNDFDQIEQYRKDKFFKLAMNVKTVPSSPTMRQRLDNLAITSQISQMIMEESACMLANVKAPLTGTKINKNGILQESLPIDIDVSPFDNSGTKKESVSRTYKGCDGYAPIFAYLGNEGYCINVQLRPGKDHCQNGTPEFLAQTIDYAQQVQSGTPLLVRMDSGNDSKDNMAICLDRGVDFIIKHNLRRESQLEWLDKARQHSDNSYTPRPGKTVYEGAEEITLKADQDHSFPVRLIYQVIERTILRNGQMLLVPEIEVESYWTTLDGTVADIAALYHEHGTMEQFHSEIKTELDLERLPSGKFASNDLVLHLGILAYNILRFIGQMTLQLEGVPLRKKAQRRRIRTVIQNMITQASRLVQHARKTKLRFSRHNPWLATFQKVYEAISFG
jgi:hypothetical protein